MKLTLATLAALLVSPAFSFAQSAEELKKEMNQRLAELEKSFAAQKKKIVAEFEAKIAKLKEPKKEKEPSKGKESGTGLESILDKLGKRLVELDERLSQLEKRLDKIAGIKTDKSTEKKKDVPEKKSDKEMDKKKKGSEEEEKKIDKKKSDKESDEKKKKDKDEE